MKATAACWTWKRSRTHSPQTWQPVVVSVIYHLTLNVCLLAPTIILNPNLPFSTVSLVHVKDTAATTATSPLTHRCRTEGQLVGCHSSVLVFHLSIHFILVQCLIVLCVTSGQLSFIPLFVHSFIHCFRVVGGSQQYSRHVLEEKSSASLATTYMKANLLHKLRGEKVLFDVAYECVLVLPGS